MKQPMYLYNTLTRQKDVIDPVTPDRINLYACGPTVYNYAHIGNLRTYIFEDTLKKALKYLGYDVTHAMNITDVGHLESDSDTGEDKLSLGAAREQKSPWDLARFYEEAFFKDCEALGISKPDIVCRATEHIQDMIAFIQQLEQKGFTYTSGGNVYFSIDQFPDYPELSNRKLDDLIAGSRIEVDANKKNPLDFVLWFTASKFPNQIMKWESPWGVGFPGWHIECSAMSMKYFGERLDIHCGGEDHISVHHTNERAQSEALTGKKWVNHWVHGAFLVVNQSKMSKSSGDFLTVDRLVESGFNPLSYRYYVLQSKYRRPLKFSFENLEEAEKGYLKLLNKTRLIQSEALEKGHQALRSELVAPFKEQFAKHLSDDLNLANAMTVLYDILKNKTLHAAEKSHLIEEFDTVLSLGLVSHIQM